MYRDQEKLLEFLDRQGLVNQSALTTVTAKSQETGKAPEMLLLEDNLIEEEKLNEVKAELLNVPAARLVGLNIPPNVLKILPLAVADNYRAIVFEKKDNELRVGLTDPQNFKAIEAVEFLAQKSNLKVKYFIISESSFRQALKRYQVFGDEVKQALANISEDVFKEIREVPTEGSMAEMIKSAPVSKMVLVIIRHAIDGKASDIHIEPSDAETHVRYRIDGILKTSLVLPRYIHSAIIARIKVLANLRLDETRKPQDGRIRLNFDGRDIDFRVSTLPLYDGEKVVLRILDTSEAIPSLENLGFNPIHINLIKEGIKRPHGLFLLTGPTGSGKTTTLYTTLTLLNEEGVNIITLEDPIEYYLNGVNQSQINPEIGYTFASGLRAILRQDPNIIMLGEIRDEETTELVVHASLTGHMVLSTLHTNSAVGAIPRLMDLGAEPFLLSSVLNMVIGQRLARKICPDCKAEVTLPEPLLKKVKNQITTIPAEFLKDINVDQLKFFRGQGCAHCGNLGYRGRVAVSEIVNVTPTMRDIINHGGKTEEIEKELKNQNFITLTQDCLVKALQGVTTMDEVLRVSQL